MSDFVVGSHSSCSDMSDLDYFRGFSLLKVLCDLAGLICIRWRQNQGSCSSCILPVHRSYCNWHSILCYGALGWAPVCEPEFTGKNRIECKKAYIE